MAGSVRFADFRSKASDAQTESEITRASSRQDAAEKATIPGELVVNQQGDAMLPARLVRHEPDTARRISEMPKIAEDLGYAKPAPTAELADFLERRRQDALFVEREKWIADRFDLSQPEKVAWFNQIEPEFLERRRRFGYAKLDMQRQYFDVLTIGPQSKEDIDFMFAIDSGAIDLEELRTPIWEISTKSAGGDDAYVQGMFATTRPPSTATAGIDGSAAPGTSQIAQIGTPRTSIGNVYSSLPRPAGGAGSAGGLFAPRA